MLILADGRASRLENTIASDQIKVLHLPGATWLKMLTECQDAILTLRPKYLLLLCGMCDLTIWERPTTGLVLPRHNNYRELFRHMYEQLDEANRVAHERYPFTRITFGDLCGMHLETYNHRNGINDANPEAHIIEFEPLQLLLNAVVEDINQIIWHINYHNAVPHPNLSRRVHKISHMRATQHRYDLLREGMHPRRFLLSYWAKKIRKLYRRLAGVEASSLSE